MSLHSRAGLTLATCIALHAGAIAAEQLHVPTCDAFVEYGRRAVGIDEIHAAQILGFPLRDLSDHDIDLIGDALSKCSSQATSREQRSLLAEARKQLPHLRAARDRVRRAYADFAASKQDARPKLEQITASVNVLPDALNSRPAVSDYAATVSGIFFELEQRRVRAQEPAALIDDFPAYRDAMAAITRKEKVFADLSRQELVVAADAVVAAHAAAVEKLSLPADALDATIMLASPGRAENDRWLTLRQWVSLLLNNPQVTSVSAKALADPPSFEIAVIRPGYGPANFAFRGDNGAVALVGVGKDDGLGQIATPRDRSKANSLLTEVIRQR